MNNKYLVVVYEPHLLLNSKTHVIYKLRHAYMVDDAKTKAEAEGKVKIHLPVGKKSLKKALEKENKEYYRIDCYELNWVNTGGAKVFPVPEILIKDRTCEVFGDDLKKITRIHHLKPIRNLCLKTEIVQTKKSSHVS